VARRQTEPASAATACGQPASLSRHSASETIALPPPAPSALWGHFVRIPQKQRQQSRGTPRPLPLRSCARRAGRVRKRGWQTRPWQAKGWGVRGWILQSEELLHAVCSTEGAAHRGWSLLDSCSSNPAVNSPSLSPVDGKQAHRVCHTRWRKNAEGAATSTGGCRSNAGFVGWRCSWRCRRDSTALRGHAQRAQRVSLTRF
jgi:hypothetical protein